MTDLHRRTLAIQTLAQRLADQAPALVEALVSEFHIARGAAPDHVEEAILLVRGWLEPGAVHESVATGERNAQGVVAISIHADAPLTSVARTAPAAFLAGASQTVVNVPPFAPQTTARLADIFQCLPGVVFQNERPGMFLLRALTDAFTRTVWAGGPPDLFAPFDAVIQDSRSQVIFETWGNDAIVIGADADLERAAEQTAALVFRNGGIDPAAPRRVYVPAEHHDTFSELLCNAAASYTIAPWTSAACSISPMRSEEARTNINDVLDEAEDAGAELAVGLDFRDFDDQPFPTLYPTVVTGCTPDLQIVQQRTLGPVVPVVPYDDRDALLEGLDSSAAPNGQVGCAVTLIGGEDLAEDLRTRFSYVLFDGPFSPNAVDARLQWGGGPTNWSVTAGPDGIRRRYGAVDLTLLFSQDVVTSRARWRSRGSDTAAAK